MGEMFENDEETFASEELTVGDALKEAAETFVETLGEGTAFDDVGERLGVTHC